MTQTQRLCTCGHSVVEHDDGCTHPGCLCSFYYPADEYDENNEPK